MLGVSVAATGRLRDRVERTQWLVLVGVMWSWAAGPTVLQPIEGDERGCIEGLCVHSDVRRSRFG